MVRRGSLLAGCLVILCSRTKIGVDSFEEVYIFFNFFERQAKKFTPPKTTRDEED